MVSVFPMSCRNLEPRSRMNRDSEGLAVATVLALENCIIGQEKELTIKPLDMTLPTSSVAAG